MLDFLAPLFDASGFPPRWQCGTWTPEHGWLHILSDLGVWSAYMAIPAVLGYFIARKKDVPFRGIFLLFTAFILACGTTHLMEAIIFWWPAYRLAGVLKFLTAVVSWVTVVALVRVTPKMLAMRTPEELEREVAARRAAEAGLVLANAELEERVQQRTDELTRANAALSEERERFRTTLSSIGDAVIATDTAGRVTFLNPVAEALTGWSADRATGEELRSVFRIVNESTRKEVENPAVRALREGAIVGLVNHTVLVARDGSEHPIDDCAAPIWNAASGVAGAVLVFRDITERQRAENQIRDSEERFRAFMNHIPAQTWIDDESGVNRFANPALARELRRPVGDIIGRPVAELMAGFPVSEYLESNRRVTESGEPFIAVLPAPRHDGSVGRFLVHKFPLGPSPAGRRLIGGVAIDVTDQLRAEEELRASEERLLLALSAGEMGTFDWDVASGRVVWSRSHYELFGYDASESFPVEFRHFKDRVHPDDWPGVEGTLRDAMSARIVYAQEHRIRRPDSTERWVAATGRFHYDAEGRAVRMVGVVQDISSRKRAEAERTELLARLNLQVERLPLAYLLSGPDFRYTRWNPAAERIFGFTQAEVLGRHPFEVVVPEESRPLVAAVFARLQAGDMDAHGTCENVTGDGRTIICEWYNTPLFGPDGTFQGVLSLAQDVTARRRAERELHLRDRAIQTVVAGIIITDAARSDNPIIFANRGFERLTGYTVAEVIGRNCRFLQGPRTDPAVAAELRQAVRDARPWDAELLNYRKDGTPFWNQLQISPVRDESGRLTHFIGVQSDVTGRRKLEEQLRQAQKLEAVGQLAGGVAHDFNNLLTVVNGCGELVLLELAADAPTRPLVEDIVRAGERGAALTRQLLAFSRQQMLRVEVFDPNKVLLDTAKLLTRLLDEDVILRTALDPAAGFVKGDVVQIEQVVINLAVNGRDAMPRGGTLTIETAPAEVAESDLTGSSDARPGRYVRLTVTDTGEGMSAEVQARLFEPFFTTKGLGKGTGLGLATVYGIVRQSGGFVTVRSEVGKGTAVAVHLPRHEAESTGSKSGLNPNPSTAGSEMVLVVEDNDAVRALTTAVLTRQGYRVESAESGAAALAACDRLPTPPDLVLTDVVMPGMSGRELAEALTARFPRLKVVFLSGYTADTVLRHGVEEERVAFLQKPYTPDGLARFVREVLDDTASGRVSSGG